MASGALVRWFAGNRFLNRRLGRFLLPPTLVVPVVNGFEVQVDAGDLQGPSFYLLHGGSAAFYHYEEAEKAEIVQALAPGGVFLDIGANIGLFSLFVSRYFPSVQIHAFEPFCEHADRLQVTIQNAGIKNISVHQKCVGPRAGQLELHLHSLNSGGHSLREDQIADENRKPSVRVEMLALDDWAHAYAVKKIDVIKIDVQGAEWGVLEGSSQVIRNSSPVILVELDNRELLHDWPQVLTRLERVGLSGYQVRRAGEVSWVPIPILPELAREEGQRGRLQTNYCFSPTLKP